MRKKHIPYSLLIIVYLIISVTTSCDNTTAVSDNQNSSSNNFDLYKKKYSKAVRYFSSPQDSLKLKALFFILRNLDEQYYYDGDWIDAYNNVALKDTIKSVDDLIKKQDSISNIFPHILNKVKDKNVITDDYLIKNINRAFESKKYPWVKSVDFNDFCEYVLPYKITNEKPESWGVCLQNESYLRPDSLLYLHNMFEAANYINSHLNWYKVTTNYDYPIDLDYKMSRTLATGTCYSASRIAAFQMRALGLPIAIDYAPSWGNRSEGHHWDALIYQNHSYALDAAGPGIGFYKVEFKGVDRMPYKISKVFRKTFSTQKNSLASINSSFEPIPLVFENNRIKDVTDQYAPVSDVILSYAKNFDKKFAYLCTFNDKTWIPSFWGRIDKHEITFTNMGRDIVYLPTIYNSVDTSELKPIGSPFILFANGLTKELKVDLDQKQTLIITKKYPEDETNKIAKGDIYELFYWNGKWKTLGAQTATGNKLYYSNVPVNALYWVRDLTKGKQERIFTYENGQQIWW